MAKFLNRWAVSLVVAGLLTGCGIFHFADPLAMEEVPSDLMEKSPSDLSGVKDLIQVHNDAGTEPMGFCAKEYALQGSSSKVLACWDGGSLPSLSACQSDKWKVHYNDTEKRLSWGFSVTFMSEIACSIFTSNPMFFLPKRTAIIKIEHQLSMPPKDSNPSPYEYQLLLVPAGNAQPNVPVHTWRKSAMDNYAVEDIVSTPELSMTSWRGIEFKAKCRVMPCDQGVPGWLIRGLAIIQK